MMIGIQTNDDWNITDHIYLRNNSKAFSSALVQNKK